MIAHLRERVRTQGFFPEALTKHPFLATLPTATVPRKKADVNNVRVPTPQSELEFLEFFRRLDGLSVPTDVHTRKAIQHCQTLTLVARGIGIHPSDSRLDTDTEATARSSELRDAKGANYQFSFTRGSETFAWGMRRLDTRYARLSGTNEAPRNVNPDWSDLPHAFFSFIRSRSTGYPEPGPFGTTKSGFEACWMGTTIFGLQSHTYGEHDLQALGILPSKEWLQLTDGFKLMQDAWQLFGKHLR